MTRKEIESEYTVENGIIRSPGKFEGEPVYAPDFYDAAMDGCGEDLAYMDDGWGEFTTLIAIEDSDRKEWPEIDHSEMFALVTESNQGFVSVQLLTENEATKVRLRYRAA